jgi:hypothetical protein
VLAALNARNQGIVVSACTALFAYHGRFVDMFEYADFDQRQLT